MFGGGQGVAEALVLIVIVGIAVAGWWKIFSRAGYPGFLGLLIFVPIVGFVAFLWLAFLPWPVQDKVRELQLPSSNR